MVGFCSATVIPYGQGKTERQQVLIQVCLMIISIYILVFIVLFLFLFLFFVFLLFLRMFLFLFLFFLFLFFVCSCSSCFLVLNLTLFSIFINLFSLILPFSRFQGPAVVFIAPYLESKYGIRPQQIEVIDKRKPLAKKKH
jgi:hypothetical protein